MHFFPYKPKSCLCVLNFYTRVRLEIVYFFFFFFYRPRHYNIILCIIAVRTGKRTMKKTKPSTENVYVDFFVQRTDSGRDFLSVGRLRPRLARLTLTSRLARYYY